VERALSSRRLGPYTLQAAIAAVHANSPNAATTDWAKIVGLYVDFGAFRTTIWCQQPFTTNRSGEP
jgi:predicted RNA polymerase sigma factor